MPQQVGAVKALTVKQPWASLIMSGDKRIETRVWATSYRGPLAIHAAKSWTAEDRRFASEVCGRILLDIPEPNALPRGAVLGIVELLDVLRVDYMKIGPREAFFGDFSPGRFGWILAIVRTFPEPIPARGALGLWEWTRP